jgi:hypothetical protein
VRPSELVLALNRLFFPQVLNTHTHTRLSLSTHTHTHTIYTHHTRTHRQANTQSTAGKERDAATHTTVQSIVVLLLRPRQWLTSMWMPSGARRTRKPRM